MVGYTLQQSDRISSGVATKKNVLKGLPGFFCNFISSTAVSMDFRGGFRAVAVSATTFNGEWGFAILFLEAGIYNRIRGGEYTISSGEGDISLHPERRYMIASGEGYISSHPGRGIYHRILGGGYSIAPRGRRIFHSPRGAPRKFTNLNYCFDYSGLATRYN